MRAAELHGTVPFGDSPVVTQGAGTVPSGDSPVGVRT
jgi:hypothetical protein